MIARVFFIIRIPCGFLAENDLAIHHRSHLAVAPSEIEANATTIEMPPQLAGGILLGSQVLGQEDFKGSSVDGGHEIGIESPCDSVLEMGTQGLAKLQWTIEVNTMTSPRPQEKLQQALRKAKVQFGPRMLRRKDFGLMAEDRVRGLLQGKTNGCRVTARHNKFGECSVPRSGRSKGWIERWLNLRVSIQ